MSLMTTNEARNLTLMGQPGSWDNYARRRLDDCPDTVLRQALRFFRECHAAQPSERLQEQIVAIRIVLEHHEATSPQQRLAL